MPRVAEGSVRLKNGKWEARLRGKHLGTFESEQEAWDAVNAMLKLTAGKAPDSLRLYGAHWLSEREEAGDIRDIKNERGVWRTHIDTAKFADWPMKRITKADIQDWLVAMSKKKKLRLDRRKVDGHWVSKLAPTSEPLSRGVVRHARRILKACFDQGAIDRKCAQNPVQGVKMPKMARIRHESDEWTFLSAPEIRALFAKIEKAKRADYYRAVFAVAIYGGLREGEIWGLQWNDVKPHELHVRQSYDEAVKADSSHRKVPMLRPLRDALERWKRDGNTIKARGLVFPTHLGGMYSPGYDANWVTQWRGKTGCAEQVRFHDLRHTCGSHLVMGTWGRAFSLMEVRDWLGHSDVKTTQRYARLAPDALRERVRRLDVESGE